MGSIPSSTDFFATHAYYTYYTFYFLLCVFLLFFYYYISIITFYLLRFLFFVLLFFIIIIFLSLHFCYYVYYYISILLLDFRLGWRLDCWLLLVLHTTQHKTNEMVLVPFSILSVGPTWRKSRKQGKKKTSEKTQNVDKTFGSLFFLCFDCAMMHWFTVHRFDWLFHGAVRSRCNRGRI